MWEFFGYNNEIEIRSVCVVDFLISQRIVEEILDLKENEIVHAYVMENVLIINILLL